MADAGDITYAEAYEKAEEDFDWQSDAQEDMDGEYGTGEYGDGEYGEMATPDPTGELASAAEDDMDDDMDDDDDDSDWDDDDDHDHLADVDDDDDDDEMESPSGRM